jgi:hypothetical protein
VTPQILQPAGVSVATKGDRLRRRHSISGRWDLPFELLSKDYAIIQVLVTLQDWFGIKPMGKKKQENWKAAQLRSPRLARFRPIG